MINPCCKCEWSGSCEEENTPFVRDIVARGHAKCAAYEPEKPKKKKPNKARKE